MIERELLHAECLITRPIMSLTAGTITALAGSVCNANYCETLAATMAAVTSLKLRDIWLCKQCVCRSAILPHPFTQANINTGQKLAKTSKCDMKRKMSLSLHTRSCQIESCQCGQRLVSPLFPFHDVTLKPQTPLPK